MYAFTSDWRQREERPSFSAFGKRTSGVVTVDAGPRSLEHVHDAIDANQYFVGVRCSAHDDLLVSMQRGDRFISENAKLGQAMTGRNKCLVCIIWSEGLEFQTIDWEHRTGGDGVFR